MFGAKFVAADGVVLGNVVDAWVDSDFQLSGIVTYDSEFRFWRVDGNAVAWSDGMVGTISFRYLSDEDHGRFIDLSEPQYPELFGYQYADDGVVSIRGGIALEAYDASDVEEIQGMGSSYSISATYDLFGGLTPQRSTIVNEEIDETSFSLGLSINF